MFCGFRNDWDLEQYEGPIRLLQAWQLVLPSFIYDHLLVKQQVLPKLRDAVENSASFLSSQWLYPWLPLLGDEHLGDLKSMLQSRLARDIAAVPTRDPSFLSSIEKWRILFTESDFDLFMSRYIVPKLMSLMRDEFVVNPKDQDLGTFLLFYCKEM